MPLSHRAKMLMSVQSLSALAAQHAADPGRSRACQSHRRGAGGHAEALLDALDGAKGARFTIATPAFPDNKRTVFKGHLFVGDEVAQLRFVLVADRLLQRDRRLRAAADLLDLVRRQLDVPQRESRVRVGAGIEQPLHGLGVVDVERRRVGARVVGAHHFHRAAIARPLLLNHHNAIVRLFARTYARQSNH